MSKTDSPHEEIKLETTIPSHTGTTTSLPYMETIALQFLK